MNRLTIRWQRLVDEKGKTCPRCGSTEIELDKACTLLERALTPLSIEILLEKGSLDRNVFDADTLQSNRLWIAGKPIEDWLGASAGQSSCCGPCGDAECRTVEFGGSRYENIPAALIVKACLRAAADMLS